MNAEYLTALAAIIAIAISFRTSSHTELRSLYDSLRADFKQAQDREERYEKRIEELEKEVQALTRQADNYKRYITRLIAQLEQAQIVPVKMDSE